ncbi:16S rRNA (cytidine(1402)-2'-O)-methyltransferase [Candidatus Riesia pediculischaeffi]|uniref:Ribosomal RNA small subunit methyltransferase I n=1 Tax=Candidatus Riesia pediculischaeffi TaxID=428411 RepID=A0A1V0HL02_9ENTR|nr:16S rRNA (cytidine(1402)-2'-O)-methyltransferase [Candidatus Riesia pediculischaeffi]ARC53494.1 16S rRNA methyltransferase [Candidatus Riesia pediculischaeffi]
MSSLYIVPTPIGNLEDITLRAINVLKEVDLIAVENIRRTLPILNYYQIRKRIVTLNRENELFLTGKLVSIISKGKKVAIVSSSGTPLINDPGYYFVSQCIKQSIRVIPLPGACSAITALSASGMPSDRFCYEGFLPRKKLSKSKKLKQLDRESRTLIFYESPRRILNTLECILNIFGNSRKVVLAREVTKLWESFQTGTAGYLIELIKRGEIKQKGEIVLIVEGYKIKKSFERERTDNKINSDVQKLLVHLLKFLSLKGVVQIVGKACNIDKNYLYNFIIKNRQTLNDL